VAHQSPPSTSSKPAILFFLSLAHRGWHHQVLLQAQVVALSLSSTFMLYTSLGLFTNCKSPVVVVLRCFQLFYPILIRRVDAELSGSMEPGIYRGDLLFLSNYAPQEYKNGDITVYQVPGEAIPIVHRVVQTHSGPGNGFVCLILFIWHAFSRATEFSAF